MTSGNPGIDPQRRLSNLPPAAILILSLSLSPLPVWGGNYQKDFDGEIPKPGPDRALLCVVRETSPPFARTFQAFVDDVPIGFLPEQSWVAIHVESGMRILWGPDQGKPAWFELEAGRLHLIRLMEQWETDQETGGLRGTFWYEDDPAGFDALIQEGALTRVELTAEGRAKLQEVGSRGVKRARYRAGPPPQPGAGEADLTFPIEFKEIVYRGGDLGFFRDYELRGTMTISRNSIELAAKKETVEIPVSSVQSVRFAQVEGDPYNIWAVITYGDADNPEMAAFMNWPKPETTPELVRAIRTVLKNRPDPDDLIL